MKNGCVSFSLLYTIVEGINNVLYRVILKIPSTLDARDVRCTCINNKGRSFNDLPSVLEGKINSYSAVCVEISNESLCFTSCLSV